MRLNYIGQRTVVAMAAIVAVALLSAAFGRQPSECSRFGTSSIISSQIKRPALPPCLESLSMMRSEASISLCKSALTAYVDDMDQYSRCLAAENKEAIREGNEAIEKFNCIARGQSICY